MSIIGAMSEHNLRIEVIPAGIASDELLATIRDVGSTAFRPFVKAAKLSPEQEDIFNQVHLEQEQYNALLRDPNNGVGVVYNPNQQYREPLIATATTPGGELVGAINGAENMSWKNMLHRVVKEVLPKPVAHYWWVGKAAVVPELQSQGIGGNLLTALLGNADPRLYTAAYVYPQITPRMPETLRRHGFVTTDELQKTSTSSLTQLRFQGPTVRALLESLSGK